MTSPGCPSEREIAGYVLGTIGEQAADSVADHVEECPQCEQTLETLEKSSDTVSERLRRPAPVDEYLTESAYQRCESLVEAIGVAASDTSFRAGENSGVEVADLGELGQYKLLAKLGEGGMGTVYKALHTKLKRVVALKVLPSERLNDRQAAARFEREMEAVGGLTHQNIVAAHDAGEIDGMHYLVMEMVEGIDLSALVRKTGPAVPRLGRTSKSDREAPSNRDGLGSPSYDVAMTVADACEMIRQAAIGLQHAHKKGMVHRDTKPSNLMLARTEDGDPIVKILDMGLALLDEQHAGERRDLTGTGQLMGTLDYMAPEQGTDTHNVDIRADVYALGATLFKLLAGRPPFPPEEYNSPIKLMITKSTQDAPSIGTVRDDLPPELVAVVDRLLAREPDKRISTPQEVAETLAPFAESADLKALLNGASDEQASSEAPRIGLKSAAGQIDPTDPFAATIDMDDTTALEESSPNAAGAGVPRVHSRNNKPTPGVAPTAATTKRSRTRVATITSALGAVILLGVVTLFFQSKHGTIVVEVDDPEIQVTLAGEALTITKQNSDEQFQIKPGAKTLRVRRADLEFETEQFTLKRGERVVLRVKLIDGEVRVLGANERVIGRADVEQRPRDRDAAQERPVVAKIPVVEPADVGDAVGGAKSGDTRDAVDFSVEQEVSRWVFEGDPDGVPGSSSIKVTTMDGTDMPVNSLADLPPDGRFRITSISLHQYHVPLTEALVVLLSRLPWLSEIGANFRDCTEETVAKLADLQGLRELGLHGAKLTTPVLDRLVTLISLEKLTLSSMPDDGLGFLEQFPQLERLSLNGVPVSDETVLPVRKLKGLRMLDLAGTQVSPATVDKLAESLPGCRILHHAHPVARDTADREFTKTVLSFSGSRQPFVGISVDRRFLVLQAGDPVPESGMLHATVADFGGNTACLEAAQPHLSQMPYLDNIHVHHMRLESKHIDGLVQAEGLTNILLQNTGIKDTDLACFADMPKLQSINAANNSNLTDAGIAPLSRLPRLMKLDVSNSQLTDAGLMRLVSPGRQLAFLNVVGTNVTAGGVSKLRDAVGHCLVESGRRRNRRRATENNGAQPAGGRVGARRRG